MLKPMGGLSPALLAHYGESRPDFWQSGDLAFSTFTQELGLQSPPCSSCHLIPPSLSLTGKLGRGRSHMGFLLILTNCHRSPEV